MLATSRSGWCFCSKFLRPVAPCHRFHLPSFCASAEVRYRGVALGTGCERFRGCGVENSSLVFPTLRKQQLSNKYPTSLQKHLHPSIWERKEKIYMRVATNLQSVLRRKLGCVYMSTFAWLYKDDKNWYFTFESISIYWIR